MSTVIGGSGPFPVSPAQQAQTQAAINAFLGANPPPALATGLGLFLGNTLSSGLGYQLFTSAPRGSGGPSVVTVYDINNPAAANTVKSGLQGAILEGSTNAALSDSAGGGQFLAANSGNDTLNGLGGNDTIVAGSGNDTINWNGAATIIGGGGNISLGTTGSSFAFVGSVTGNDTIVNTTASATLYGGVGNSTNPGANNSFSGGTGSTTFYAGTGNDTFTGGTGSGHSDTFVFNSTEAYGGNVTVAGYTPGQTTVQLVGDTVSASSFVGGNTDLTLTDGTHLTFVQFNGVNLTASGSDALGVGTTGTVHL